MNQADTKIKKVVISCGPIPAKLDSVKIITNKFHGGLAFKTAEWLMNKEDICLTIIASKNTKLPYQFEERDGTLIFHGNDNTVGKYGYIIRVEDVIEYCKWFETHAKEYDAFIMAAAVANLMPINSFKGKFPSHLYKPGDEINIPFTIAPRAIDIIKKQNPHATLIGYKLFDGTDDVLIAAAKQLRKESRADVIFANHPKTAKFQKIAVFNTDAIIRCNFEQHEELIYEAITAKHFHTAVMPLTEAERNNPKIRHAINVVKLYEKTFTEHGSVAVPIDGKMFATTSRGHKSEPVIIRSINFETHTIIATGKATLNAPTLGWLLQNHTDRVIVHRHDTESQEDMTTHLCRSYSGFSMDIPYYTWPGTTFDYMYLKDRQGKAIDIGVGEKIRFFGHGSIRILPIQAVDWSKYYEQFPSKYFSIPEDMQSFIDKYNTPNAETLEVGGNSKVCTKYAYDPYVQATNAINFTTNDVERFSYNQFDLTVMKNSINYVPENVLRRIVQSSKNFVANTFLVAPNEKVTDNEVATKIGCDIIQHTLRLDDDSLVNHQFYAYNREFYENLGLTVIPYGKNSALLTKE